MKRIVALNIQAGGGNRVSNLLRHLDHHDPDTVILTEWRPGRVGSQIEAWAHARRMHYASLNDGGTLNGVFIASSDRFSSESARPVGISAGVLMLVRFESFTALACYFPMGPEKASFFARCAEIAAQHTATPFLIVGDLNTGNQTMDRDQRGARYHCAESFDALSGSHNLCDLWRRSNAPHTREFKWLSHTKNGFRIDHAFGNRAFVEWADPACHYDHKSREFRWTDHSTLVLTCSERDTSNRRCSSSDGIPADQAAAVPGM